LLSFGALIYFCKIPLSPPVRGVLAMRARHGNIKPGSDEGLEKPGWGRNRTAGQQSAERQLARRDGEGRKGGEGRGGEGYGDG
jgi:hypothetical protein